MAELFIGLMSGTSMDGIDAALTDFSDHKPRLIEATYLPFTNSLAKQIQRVANPEHTISLEEYGQLDAKLGYLYADLVLTLLKKSSKNAAEIHAIGSHEQTVFHAPGAKPAFCLQIGDPNIIAETTGITTVADFRRRDIAAGGQGAPLTPAFHQVVFSDPGENRIILNIGGMANITLLPKNQNLPVSGFDTGPGNVLMDYWINKNLSVTYDENGNWANSGTCNADLLDELLNDPYFSLAPPKSTGKEYFSPSWLEHKLTKQKHISPEDVQASLCQLTAATICDEITKLSITPDRILVCGGGVHNSKLTDTIKNQMACPVVSTDEYGLDPDQVEAVAFAWLARQTLHNLPGNLTSVTGAKKPVTLGAIYPG